MRACLDLTVSKAPSVSMVGVMATSFPLLGRGGSWTTVRGRIASTEEVVVARTGGMTTFLLPRIGNLAFFCDWIFVFIPVSKKHQ